MPLILLSSDRTPQPIASIDDAAALAHPGPAVILSFPASPAETSTTEASVANARPLAYREAGADWEEIDFEAADHWVQMGPQLRSRLVEDHLATLDVAEFKIATNGGSASIITNNWVYSGSPRLYRVAGRLREFVTVLGELG